MGSCIIIYILQSFRHIYKNKIQNSNIYKKNSKIGNFFKFYNK